MTTPPEPLEPPQTRWFPLVTPRLTLREFGDQDLDDIHAYGCDPEVVRYMDWGPNTPELTRKFLDDRLAEQRVWPRLAVNLALESAAEARVIGAVRLEVSDPANRAAEIGYTLHRAWWGLGLASEAAQALARVGFGVLGLHRLWATCDARNTGSQRVLEKLGMRSEGELRRNAWMRDRWRDTRVYAVLAEEWAGRG
jgi:[ribosomal protein S5]-alanine N-acetyltransferase